MVRDQYELERPMKGYDAGAVLEVTARYGSWHLYDVRLEPVAESETGSIELSVEELKSGTTPDGSWEATSTPART